MMDIKNYTTLIRGGVYYFINEIEQTLNISSCILVYVDILYMVIFVMLRCGSPPPPLKIFSLTTKNASSPTVFDLGG